MAQRLASGGCLALGQIGQALPQRLRPSSLLLIDKTAQQQAQLPERLRAFHADVQTGTAGIRFVWPLGFCE